MSKVTVVRVYVVEGEGRLEAMLRRLHDDEKVRGVTVFRGVSGFGPSGHMHSSRMIDLSLDLPIVVEFFDTPARVKEILGHLDALFKPGHVVTWQAECND